MDMVSARPTIWPGSPIIGADSPPLNHEHNSYNSSNHSSGFDVEHMSSDSLSLTSHNEPLFSSTANTDSSLTQAMPLQGPATHPEGQSSDFPFSSLDHQIQYTPKPSTPPSPTALPNRSHSPQQPDMYFSPSSNEMFSHSRELSRPLSPSPEAGSSQGGAGANHYPSSSGVPRLPPILLVEKRQVTTSATQLASASRRRNEAHFVCPVPGCGSTFTRRFNLKGHLRSHTEERPYACEWPGCTKSFARQHDCKRHQALHTAKTSQTNVCQGCKKTFSRLDALNRHLRSEGGAECRAFNVKYNGEDESRSDETSGENLGAQSA